MISGPFRTSVVKKWDIIAPFSAIKGKIGVKSNVFFGPFHGTEWSKVVIFELIPFYRITEFKLMPLDHQEKREKVLFIQNVSNFTIIPNRVKLKVATIFMWLLPKTVTHCFFIYNDHTFEICRPLGSSSFQVSKTPFHNNCEPTVHALLRIVAHTWEFCSFPFN